MDDHPDLDELFKRSISEQGYLVYYPVLLKPATFDGTEWEKHTCDETLTVHYTDGSTDTLTADAWRQYYKELPKTRIPIFARQMESRCSSSTALMALSCRRSMLRRHK